MYDRHISEVSEQNYNHDITLDFIDINDFFFSFLCFVALVHFELFFFNYYYYYLLASKEIYNIA